MVKKFKQSGQFLPVRRGLGRARKPGSQGGALFEAEEPTHGGRSSEPYSTGQSAIKTRHRTPDTSKWSFMLPPRSRASRTSSNRVPNP
jgi:hypothetical protein